MNMRTMVCFAASIALTGCVSTGEVTPMGRDTFMVGTDVTLGSGVTSTSSLMSRNLKTANAYCAAQNKVMVPDSVQTQGVRGFTPVESNLTFRCVTSGDPDNQRPVMRPGNTNTIIVR